MENNCSILSLSSTELMQINGGSAAYEAGYNAGTYAGKGIKYLLLIIGLAALF